MVYSTQEEEVIDAARQWLNAHDKHSPRAILIEREKKLREVVKQYDARYSSTGR